MVKPAQFKALVDIDLSSLELRHGAVEPDGSATDIHRATAAGIFGVAYVDVTPEQRREGKRCNFLKIYGG